MEKQIEEGAEIDKRDDEGQTPLLWATREGYESIVKILLATGANPNSSDHKGQTPLFWAAHKGYESIVTILLQSGADPNSSDHKGQTPLFWAAHKGYESIVRILLQSGANPNSRDHKGGIPLSWATSRIHAGIVDILLVYGMEWPPESIVQDPRAETSFIPPMNPSADDHSGYEMPFSDSGYASAPVVHPWLNSAVARTSGKKNSDSETVISAVTTIAQAVAQNFISEVCNDICARLQRHVDADNQNLLFDVVPDLIKAFALRLAQIDPSPANRGIMHCVYSRNS